MKILLMGFAKLKYMPYAQFYLQHIDASHHEVHILYWNRDGKPEATDAYQNIHLHEFVLNQSDEASKLSKIGAFLHYKKFAETLLAEENFDFVIALHTMPAVLTAKTLSRQYTNRYIFDYRDVTYEKFAPFRHRIHKIVLAAKATFVSSDAFRKYLPKCDKIYTSHNLALEALNHKTRFEKQQSNTPLRIAFWGYIRHFSINKELIEKVAVDSRFELHYYGKEEETALKLKKTATDIGADNIFFHGEYSPEQRYSFAENTDIIHNIYHDENMMLAMPNKYYDALVFQLPQVCMPDSFMGSTAEKAGVGTVLDPRCPDFLDNLWEYYQNIDSNSFSENCDKELSRVFEEYQKGATFITETCQG